MKPPVTVEIGHKSIALIVILPTVGKVFSRTFSEIILIYKIVAGVIRRVNIDHFDLAKIGFLQEFEHVEVIALDIQVFGGVKIHAFFPARAQRGGNRRVRQQYGLLLIRPRKLIALFVPLHDNGRKLLSEHIKINTRLRLSLFVQPLRQTIRKQFPDPPDIFIYLID